MEIGHSSCLEASQKCLRRVWGCSWEIKSNDLSIYKILAFQHSQFPSCFLVLSTHFRPPSSQNLSSSKKNPECEFCHLIFSYFLKRCYCYSLRRLFLLITREISNPMTLLCNMFASAASSVTRSLPCPCINLFYMLFVLSSTFCLTVVLCFSFVFCEL